jgi:hypothetical protein
VNRRAEEVGPEEHGPDGVYVRLSTGGRVLKCACGFLAEGYDWQEAGGEMDRHIEEQRGA